MQQKQEQIINIIFFVVLVMIVGIATAIVGPFIDDQQASNNYSATTNMIMNMIVPIIWLGAIITFFLYVTPVRTNQF